MIVPEVKPVGPEAIPLIQELTQHVWPQTYAHLLSTEQMAYMLHMMYSTEALQQQMQNGHQFVVALYQNEPGGFASYGALDGQPAHYQLHKLYVRTTIQKAGLGKTLLWYVMDQVKAKGAICLQLQVNRQNEKAIAFYERMGFHKKTEANFDIGHGYFMNDYVMELRF